MSAHKKGSSSRMSPAFAGVEEASGKGKSANKDASPTKRKRISVEATDNSASEVSGDEAIDNSPPKKKAVLKYKAPTKKVILICSCSVQQSLLTCLTCAQSRILASYSTGAHRLACSVKESSKSRSPILLTLFAGLAVLENMAMSKSLWQLKSKCDSILARNFTYVLLSAV